MMPRSRMGSRAVRTWKGNGAAAAAVSGCRADPGVADLHTPMKAFHAPLHTSHQRSNTGQRHDAVLTPALTP